MTTKINAIGIVVHDLHAAMAFYRRLGCEFPAIEAGNTHVEADLGGVRLMLDAQESVAQSALATGQSVPPRQGVALAAECESPAQVDAMYAQLAAEGLGTTEPFDAPWGQRYATVTDPDGTPVDLYAWLATADPAAV